MINNKKEERRNKFHRHDFVSRAFPLPRDFKPQDNDILCGRGNAYCHHPGNIVFSKLIRHHAQRYRETFERIKRSIMVADVLDEIQELGCRFVKKYRKTNQWFEFSREQAHEKVGHALRDMIRFQDDDSMGSSRSSETSKSSFSKRTSSWSKIAKREDTSKFISLESREDTSKIISPTIGSGEELWSLLYEPLNDFLGSQKADIHFGESMFKTTADAEDLKLDEYLADLVPEEESSEENLLDSSDFYKVFQILSEE